MVIVAVQSSSGPGYRTVVEAHSVGEVERVGSSGFANTDLQLHLTRRGISHLVLIGMRANTCIDTTARYAQELGYHVTLNRDAIGAFSALEINATFELFAPTYAQQISTSAEFIKALGGP